MKTIIVATDFSKEAENATAYAAALTQQIGGKILLFHRYMPSIHVSNARPSPIAFDESVNKVRARLAQRVDQLSESYAVPVSSYLSMMGDIKEDVERLIVETNAVLLVMGMAAKSLEQDLLGNTTTTLIHRLSFPILAVPYRVKFKGIDRILFACDNLQGIHRVVLEQIRDLAMKVKASVEIFHVNNKIQQLLKDGVDEQTITNFGEGLEGVTYYYKDVDSNAVIKEIQQELTAIDADLLIMLPNRYGFWASMIHRSKTRIMASGMTVPLLSIPLVGSPASG